MKKVTFVKRIAVMVSKDTREIRRYEEGQSDTLRADLAESLITSGSAKEFKEAKPAKEKKVKLEAVEVEPEAEEKEKKEEKEAEKPKKKAKKK